MNATQPAIPIELVLDRHTTQEVLQAVLHSILFHRLFGLVKPRTYDVLDVTMPAADDTDISKLVDEKVEAFWRGMESGANKRGQIIVAFYRPTKKSLWKYIMGEEEVPWEQWSINVEIRQPITEKERQKFSANLSSALTKSLQTMLTHTFSERGLSVVPPITDPNTISPFPFKITVSVSGVEVG